MKKYFIVPLLCLSLTITQFAQGEDTDMNSQPYTARERQFLIDLARASVYFYLHDKSLPKIDESTLPDSFKEKRGCFVTLEARGQGLRGCIGYILPVNRLLDNVIDRAVDAAVRDPRFRPVTFDELKNIKIEISILTVPRELNVQTPEELLDAIEPMRHGVVLKTPYGSSTYLPQVWEQLTDKETFLSSLCAKHGAPRDMWRQTSRVSVSLYEAIVFHEDTYGRIIVPGAGAVAGPGGAVIIGKVAWNGHDMEAKRVPEGTRIEPLSILDPSSDIIIGK